ncbi:hypothetical protein [Haloprofundus marisrubri]|nr:hypothetical protein [Haloprofundus marisrubri]
MALGVSIFARFELDLIALVPVVGIFAIALVALFHSPKNFDQRKYLVAGYLATQIYILVVQPSYATTAVKLGSATFSIGAAAYLLLDWFEQRHFAYYICVAALVVSVYLTLSYSVFWGILLAVTATAVLYQRVSQARRTSQ